jgi:uncharacterized protein
MAEPGRSDAAARGPWMQCYSGTAFFPFDPRPEDVRLVDVAHHLAYKCRFAGACLQFYSVGEHSVRASFNVAPEHALATLLHDAPEAFGPDIPRPWKLGLKLLGTDRGLRTIDQRITIAVGCRFGVDLLNLAPEVHHADNVMLATERRDLMAPSELEWDWLPEPLPDRIVPWSPREAELRFIERYVELTEVA